MSGGYFEEIQRQLVDRCEHGAHHRRRLSIDWHRGWSAVALVGSMSVVAIVVALALGLKSSHQHGAPGSTPHGAPMLLTRRQITVVSRKVTAIVAQAEREPSCRPQPGPAIRTDAPDRALLSILGVLRRGETPNDRLPKNVLRSGTDVPAWVPPWSHVKGTFVKYVRLARTVAGTSYYVIPVAQTGTLTSACVATAKRDLQQQLAGEPPSLRRAMLAQGTNGIEQRAPSQAVILLEHGTINGGTGPRTAAEIEHPDGIGGTGDGAYVTLEAILPDGVAAIDFSPRNVGTAARPSAGQGARSVTAPVINNVVVARIPRAAFPLKTVWKRADGSIIRTFG